MVEALDLVYRFESSRICGANRFILNCFPKKLSWCSLPGWLAVWLAGCLVGWLSGWLTVWLAGSLVGRLSGWPTVWLAGYLVGWLSGWLTF